MLTCTYNDAALRAVLKSDFDSLSGNISSASQINAVVEQVLQSAFAISRNLMRDWNACKSGSWLPAEVLARAFTFLRLHDRIAASHVSHHWRQSALGFPEVWNHIDLPPGQLKCAALVEMALSRSGQMPVRISYTAVERVPAPAHIMQVVQKSKHQHISWEIHRLRMEAIVAICGVLTARATDLSVTLLAGSDGGFEVTAVTSHGLTRRLRFTRILSRPIGRRMQDAREVAGLVLRGPTIDGLPSLTIDGSILATLSADRLPPGLRRLTLHLRNLDRRDEPVTRTAAVPWLIGALNPPPAQHTSPWDALDAIPRTRAALQVHLEIHGGDLRAEHAEQLLDKIAGLGLGHLPPLRVRGFSADVVRAVAARSADARVVFESGPLPCAV